MTVRVSSLSSSIEWWASSESSTLFLYHTMPEVTPVVEQVRVIEFPVATIPIEGAIVALGS